MAKPYAALIAATLVIGEVEPLVAGSVNLFLDMEMVYRHSFAAVEFYSDANGTHVIPTAGSVAYTLTSPLLPNRPLIFSGSTIEADSGDIVSWSANIIKVTAAITAVAGATHCRLRIIGNTT